MPKPKKPATPADHREDLVRLRRIKGQIEGVERMVQDGRYCVDILNQIKSISAALRSAESLILERHIRHCVQDAMTNKRGSQKAVDELLDLYGKR